MISLQYMLLFLISVTSIKSERLHEQIYSSIEGGAACFRRLNGTHQFGCSSSDKGAVGVVEMVQIVNDAEWLVSNSTAGPYVAVVSTAVFNSVIELFLDKPENIAGVLIFENATDLPSAFSEDSKCPNEFSSGPGSECGKDGVFWNERGTGLLRRDIPFPMFFLPESRFEEIEKIDKCYQRYNTDKDNQKGNPLCSLQLASFMYAAVNTEVCMRRSATSAILSTTKVCDPLGDHNVYYSLFPRTKETGKSESVTLVTARIDTATLFDGISPGVVSSAVGMITLLTTAATLSQMIPVTDASLYDNNVLFTLLNGESFDYIGSQRVAYDLSRGEWPPSAPLAPSRIRLHLDIGQIGGALAAHRNDTSWPFYTFAPYDVVVTEVTEFINEMSSNSQMYNMSVTAQFDKNLPPSSIHSFRNILKEYTENNQLPEVLITDHKSTFTNMYYNSALDDFRKISYVYRNISIGTNGTFISTEDLIKNGTMNETEVQVKIARLATALARTLYQRVTGEKYAGDVTASAHLVDEMLYCFIRSQACRLLVAADYAQTGGGDEKVADRPAPLYVGVAAWAGTAPVFAGHLLALLAGARTPHNRTDCATQTQPGYSFYWLKGWSHDGECIQTTMNFSQAVSPAFIIPDYQMGSGVYSSWSESVWSSLWARVFVSAAGGGARAAAAAGVVLTLLATLLTRHLQTHAHRIFTPAFTQPIPTEPATGILRSVNC